jgi:hypothetical protein
MDGSSAIVDNPPREERRSPLTDLPTIPDKGVRLAFQLAAFRSKNPNRPFDAPTTDYIDFIYAYFPPPDFSSPSWNTTAWSTTAICFPLTRDEQPKTGITKICYSIDWAVDRPTLDKDVTTFLNTVELLLQRHPSFQQWQSVLGAQFETLNALGRKGQKEKTRYRHSSETPMLGLLSNLRTSNLIRFDAKSSRIESRIIIRIRVESNNNFVRSIRFDSSNMRSYAERESLQSYAIQVCWSSPGS